MFTFVALRLASNRTIRIKEAIHQIWLMLDATISNAAKHYRQLQGSGKVKALSDGSVKGITQAPAFVPNIQLNLLRSNKPSAFTFQVNASRFSEAVDASIFGNGVNTNTVTKLVEIYVITHCQAFDKA